MKAKITHKHLTLSINRDEVFYLHDILDSLQIGDIKRILKQYDYPDEHDTFYEEREAVLDMIYKHLEEWMDSDLNNP
jgi:hypothetical protein